MINNSTCTICWKLGEDRSSRFWDNWSPTIH